MKEYLEELNQLFTICIQLLTHMFQCSCVFFSPFSTGLVTPEENYSDVHFKCLSQRLLKYLHTMTFENIQVQCLQMTSKGAGTETRKCLKLADRICQEQGYLNPKILQNLDCCFFFLLCGTLFHTRAFDQCLTWNKIKSVQ